MKRPLVIAAGILLVVLIVAGGVMTRWSVEPPGPIYAVADVAAGLRQHPQQWVGHTVAVRAIVIVYGIGIGPSPAPSWSGPLLLDPIPSAGPYHRLAPWISQVAGTMQMRFNAPGTIPTLMLRGIALPGPTPFEVARRLVVGIAAWLNGGHRSDVYRYCPPQTRVYRVRLLAPARCPVPLTPPCYTAVAR